MRVKELMSQPVRCCSITDTADQVALLMWEGDCGAVPILDDDRRLAGVVTDRDICMAALFHGTDLRGIAIGDVMSRDVCVCHPDDDIAEAEQLMSVRQVHRLPVVGDDGVPIGMFTLTDIVQQVKPPARMQKTGSAVDDCVRTLAAISEPRSRMQTTTASTPRTASTAGV